jgi:hypothetical protein
MSELSFEITLWEADERAAKNALYAADADGPALGRVRMRKRWSGTLEGESVGELMTCGEEGYVAMERVTGALDGRRGSFVLQHGALIRPDGSTRQFAYVVPGSGTGELAGLSGEGRVDHGLLTLDWELSTGR